MDAPVAAGHWGSRSKAGRATRQRVHLGCWMTTPALQYLFSASDLSISYTSDVLSLLQLVKFLRMTICTVILSYFTSQFSRVFTQSFHHVFHRFPTFSQHFPYFSHLPGPSAAAPRSALPSPPPARPMPWPAPQAARPRRPSRATRPRLRARPWQRWDLPTNGGEIRQEFSLGYSWDKYEWNMNGIWIKSRIWYLGVTLK